MSLDRIPLIVGSVGPYGAHLHDGSEYDGSYADTTSVEVLIYSLYTLHQSL